MLKDDLEGLQQRYGVVLADPPWRFRTWSKKGEGRSAARHYGTVGIKALCKLPVTNVTLPDAVLFMWVTWPTLRDAFRLIEAWGFEYKTCGFSWMKADARQIELFDAEIEADMKMGYWTRSNSEVCLLATKGKPKRLSASVRQGIIEPSREHSRKPDCVYSRIEKLVPGPYLELFARNERPGWTALGNEIGRFAVVA